ncbi:hypothetical protein CN193_29610 [Sinorhizobium meliloti]|nr:hypothetical protein CN193_29610 [Sinorhizobium meliloti]
MPDSRRPAVKVGNGGIASRRPLALAAEPSSWSRGLVDEDQLLGIEIELSVEPGYAAAQDIGTLLL